MRTPFFIFHFSLFILLLSAGFSSCQKEETFTDHEPRPIHLSADQRLILDEGGGFAFDLFREMAMEAGEQENVFMSPLSVSLALAMTWNGAGGTTREAMHKTMQLPDLPPDAINKSWQQLMKDLISVDKKVTLNIANSIWYLQGYPVQAPFIATNQTYYNAEVRELDFGRPDAADIINTWVAEKTNNLIDKIVERVSRQTVMILLNAIYFNGEWKYEFAKDETHPAPFFPESGTPVDIPMMQQVHTHNYHQNNLFALAELPYGRGNYSMLVLLPQPGVKVQEVLNSLDQLAWQEMTTTQLKPQKLNVQLPRFRFAFEQELNDVLINMGMGVAFSPAEANFSGINPDDQLFISEVIHKAFVDVNEEGTEAAAVTSVVIERTSAGPDSPIAFIANRPFLFFIRETTTNTIIFAGRVMEPVVE